MNIREISEILLAVLAAGGVALAVAEVERRVRSLAYCLPVHPDFELDENNVEPQSFAE